MHSIASLIDVDWVKFYYTLPFTPERGMTNIKKDIDDANFKFNRGDVTKVKYDKIYLILLYSNMFVYRQAFSVYWS